MVGDNTLKLIIFHADAVIVQDLDTKLPVSILRNLISKRLRNVDLSKHDIYMQSYLLDANASLYDQGFKVKNPNDADVLYQGWQTFFGECAKILKIKFSKLKPCHCIKQNKNIIEFG